MAISATVAAFENEFKATLGDGRSLEATDLHSLANALFRVGVTATQVQFQWGSGQRMLTAGQRVEFGAVFRSLERQNTRLLRVEP
jgi:hypothetical protein